ncbi:MAG: BatD family protein, partial [Gammaproteobacteria bacterium]|nr:BatD family protein [Gammaproteobacteria bacterium]
MTRKLMDVATRCLLLIMCALLLCDGVSAATSARTDRSTVRVSESVQIVFETDQDVSSRPEFSALETDFDVLGTSQSTSVNIINGRMQRSARWLVDLMPKREGVFTIPAIQIGNERSNPLTLTVKPATAAAGEPVGEIFLEVEVDTQTPYVQQQAVLTIRLYRSVQMGNASLTEPNVTGGDVIVERLGDDVGYETQRGAVRYAVVERRYALFAQNSGAAVIEPLRFEGRVPTGRQSAFDPFSQGRPVRVRSEPIELDVRPIPAEFTGTTWLPAEQVFLIESWPDDAKYRVGEPVTRTLTLRANGLTSSQLPEIAAGVPDGLRQYPDQPVLENSVADAGLVGVRQEKVALIPSRAGDLVLPALTIPWWNTRTDNMEYA